MAELPSASLAESVQFNQLVVVPNAVQGLFRRRRTPVAVAVLQSSKAAHKLADRFVAVTAEEVRLVIDEVERDDDGVLGYDAWHRAFRRSVRRIVLGDGAREDEELSELLGELMSQANGL